jgi:hypothetical protein
MTTINVKTDEAYKNIFVDFPLGALPNTGDKIELKGISHPNGAFEVAFRHFSTSDSSLITITLFLKTENM